MYTICHSQQSDQGIHSFAILSSLIRIYNVCDSFWAVLSRSTLFAIMSSLIRVYTICHSQQSDQGLHILPFSAVSSSSRPTLSFSGTVWSGFTIFATLSSLIKIYTTSHSKQFDQGLQYWPFLAVWSGSSVIVSLSSLIRVCTACHSQQSDQGLHYLPFLAVWSRSMSTLSFSGKVWSRSILFAILSSLINIEVYTVNHRNWLIRVYTHLH